MPRRTLTFRDAARGAARRLALRTGVTVLHQTSALVCGGLVLAMVAVWLRGGYHTQWPWVTLGLAVWMVATAIHAWFTRPPPLTALAVWDHTAGRGEAFLSAYCFEGETSPDAAKLVHLTRARESLAEAWPALWRELPLPRCRRVLALPPLLVGLAVSGLLVAPLPRDMVPLDATALARTREVGKSLTDRQKDISRLDGMTPKEREAARELERAMSDTAGRLAKNDTQTPEGVLSELDALARQAEALAKAMGGDAKSLSVSMIEELERHADTTDFGAAIRASQTDKIAEEARAIAERLESKTLTLDEQRRFEDALDRAMKAADETDRENTIGAKLEAAHHNLKAGEPDEAGERFDELAQQFDRVHQRQQAAERLEQLAQELRGGGQRIMQAGEQGIEQLAQAPGLAIRPMHGGDRDDDHSMPQALMPLADMPAPGSGEPLDAAMLVPSGGAPVPGEPDAMTLAGEGAAAGEPPVPGLGLNENPVPGDGGGMAPGIAPVPGVVGGVVAGSAPMPGAMAGGLQAGHGTAKLGADPTKPHEATGTATVAAAPANPGTSTTQVIDGRLHREDTVRARRESAMAFIAAEEEALHAEPLPASRREQVLRYFTMLREQLEHDHRP